MTAASASRPVQPPPATRAVLRQGLAVIWSGMRQQRGWVSIAVLGAVLWAGATVATAWAIGYLTETYITPAVQAREVESAALWAIFGLLSLILVVNVIGVILRRVTATIAGFNLQADHRRRVTRQYLRLPLTWHHAHPSGQLLSNAHSDIEATWQVFNPLPMAIGVIVMLVIAGVQMAAVDGFLALIGLLVFPLLFATNLVFQRVMSPKVTRAQQLRAEISEVAHESFEAGLVVKAMGREAQESDRFRVVTHELRDSLIDVGRTRGVFEPTIDAIPTLGTLAVLGVGTARVASGDLVAADVVQIAFLFSILAFPVRALGWVLAEIPRSVVGHRRVDAVLRAGGSMDYGPATLDSSGPARPTLQDVHFDYVVHKDRQVLGEQHDPGLGPTAQEVERVPAIRGVTLEVPAGSTTAVVGPTGSGKSSLTSVTLRLVDPDSGQVRMDGTDLREVRHGALPASAALVAQQTFMFDDTVRGNVSLGGDHSDDEITEALRIARAQDFVAQLPEGSVSASRWPGRSCDDPGCSSWTTRPALSTPGWSRTSWPGCASSGKA